MMLKTLKTRCLKGSSMPTPDYVKRLEGLDVLVRADKKRKVALVSGGGSGHEPKLTAVLFGRGMLDAAVAGAAYTSPTPDQVYEAPKQLMPETVYY